MKRLLFLIPLALAARAEERRGDNPDAKPSPAAEERAHFKLPPGFEIQLVADETQIQKPMNFNFDAAGRLWVTGSELYPFTAKTDALGQPIASWEHEWGTMSGSIGAKKPEPPGAPIDTVRVLSDFGADGRARKVETFADGLNIPIGIVPLPRRAGAKGDTVIVYSIPTIWRMEDTDGDGHADVREPLYTGFGFRDTHGMSSNYLYWVDGWIYGCHGFANHSEVRDKAGRVTVLDSGNTYRFRPDGSRFEIYTHGQTNPFGLTVDPLGNFYSADSHSKPVYMLLPGAYYEGIGKKHEGLGFAPAITQDSHGSSAIAGIAYYADDKFPAEFRDNVFIGNPVTQSINRDRFDWHGSTPMAVRMPDFLTCDDPWFRPVQVKLGPDGALYIGDFYNPIIGHYEQPLLDPRRDHTHGRIWRIAYVGEKKDATSASASPVVKDLTKLNAAQLVETLGDGNLIVRILATHELIERVGVDAKAPLRGFLEAAHAPTSPSPAHALWAFQRLSTFEKPGPDHDLLALACTTANAALRVHALRAVRERLPAFAEFDSAIIAGVLLKSDDAMLRRVATEALAPAFQAGNVISGETLVKILERANDKDDIELTHAIKVAMRDTLQNAASFTEITTTPLSADAAVHFAEVMLAIPTPAAADFLLKHLEGTQFKTAHAGEYLRHVAMNLSKEKIASLAALAEKLHDTPPAQQLAFADGLAQAARARQIQLPEALRPWLQQTMLNGLDSKDLAAVDQAIAAVRDIKDEAKAEPLLRIVMRESEHGPRRASALEALMNLPRGTEAAGKALADTSSMTLRKKAAELLVTRSADGTAAILLSALSTAPAELASIIAPALAKTDDACAALLSLVENGKAPARLLRLASVADALAKRPQPLRERVAALTKDLPPEDARLDAVIAARAEAYRVAKPYAAKGKAVFLAQCAVCHKYRNEGGNVAPNLDGVVARGPHRLVEDILDPSRNIDGAFRQIIIETKDGQAFSGVNFRESPESLTVTDATGKDVTIARANVKMQTVSRLSLMPPAFEQTIPAEDFNNLLGFLLR